MRVIAGSARRLELKTPPGLDTRPTTDRIKETLFNILQPDLYGCRFLDLFAGSGQIGIEALSRGAAYAVFVDKDRTAVGCIRDNLMHTHLADQAEVVQTDAVAAISKLHRFDVKYAAGLMTYDGVITDTSAGVWRLEDTSVSGTVTTPATAVSRVLRVTSRHSGDDVAYIVSFDAGAHWWTYVDDWREPDYSQDVYGMFEGTMRSIPSAVWAEKLNGSLMVRAILVGSATLTDIQIYTEDIIS